MCLHRCCRFHREVKFKLQSSYLNALQNVLHNSVLHAVPLILER